MLALAQEAGDEIARRVDWKRLHSQLTLTINAQAMPDDFQRFVPGGGVRTAEGDVFVRPVTNSALWGIVRNNQSAQAFYYLVNNVISIAPPELAVGALVVYISKNWLTGTSGSKPSYTADDDTAVFPERLLVKNIIWRWRRQKGLAYDDQLAEFEADLVQEINADRGLS